MSPRSAAKTYFCRQNPPKHKKTNSPYQNPNPSKAIRNPFPTHLKTHLRVRKWLAAAPQSSPLTCQSPAAPPFSPKQFTGLTFGLSLAIVRGCPVARFSVPTRVFLLTSPYPIFVSDPSVYRRFRGRPLRPCDMIARAPFAIAAHTRATYRFSETRARVRADRRPRIAAETETAHARRGGPDRRRERP